VNDPHANQTNDSAVIDMRVIADLRELGGADDPGLLAELIEMFLTDAPSRLRDVEAGLASSDIKLVERASHTLKSSSANIGAMNLSALAKRIEELARNRDQAAIVPLVAETTRSFAEAETVLRALKG
jgi:HPt (histidine-containing phosphotransfer) domain-containing protein